MHSGQGLQVQGQGADPVAVRPAVFYCNKPIKSVADLRLKVRSFTPTMSAMLQNLGCHARHPAFQVFSTGQRREDCGVTSPNSATPASGPR